MARPTRWLRLRTEPARGLRMRWSRSLARRSIAGFLIARGRPGRARGPRGRQHAGLTASARALRGGSWALAGTRNSAAPRMRRSSDQDYRARRAAAVDRPAHAHDSADAETGAQGARSRLCFPGVHSQSLPARPPHPPLGEGRADQARQPCAALLASSPVGARGRLPRRAGGSGDQVPAPQREGDSARTSADPSAWARPRAPEPRARADGGRGDDPPTVSRRHARLWDRGRVPPGSSDCRCQGTLTGQRTNPLTHVATPASLGLRSARSSSPHAGERVPEAV